jgi:lysophospholipase L1-like esterase
LWYNPTWRGDVDLKKEEDSVRSIRLSGALGLAVLGLSLTTCGSEDAAPSVEVLVFADWNGNGQQDTDEGGVKAVEVQLTGGQSEKTAQGGTASFEMVAAGSYQASIASMPPHFRITTPAQVSVEVGAGSPASARFGIRPDVPVARIPYKYVMMGDSISSGYTQNADLSYSVDGYDVRLKPLLDQHFGRSAIANRAIAGTKSSCGVQMLASRLSGEVGLLTCDCRRSDQPLGSPEDATSQDTQPFGPGAYLLVLYGTNDINDHGSCVDIPSCKRGECDTIHHLEQIVETARAAGVIPVLGTLTPGLKQGCQPQWNVNYNEAVGALNADIRAYAQSSGTILADHWKAFKSPKSPALTDLISDYHLWTTNEGKQRCGPGLHPTRKGYDLMAEVAYLAVTGQPSPYDDTPVPAFKPLRQALEDYDRFMEETGYAPEPFPFPGMKLRPRP